MSRKRNNVEFIKQGDPSFLKKLKNEIGFKEGPTVDTKREILPSDENDGDDERLEDLPQIVVLKPGDLTAEQFEEEKKRLDAEKSSKPANLDDRIIFRSTKKNSATQETASTCDSKRNSKDVSTPNKEVKNLLSFDVDDDDEEEDVTE